MRVIESMRDQANIVEQPRFDLGVVNRMIVVPATPHPEPFPLLSSEIEFGDAYLQDGHRRGFGGAPFDISCYFMSGLTVSGIGHMVLDGALIVSSDLMRNYWKASLPQINLAAETSLPVRDIAGPCVVFTGWGQDVFGHVLMEMMPRLAIARMVLRTQLPSCRYLMDINTKPWFRAMVRQSFGLDDREIEFFDPRVEQVRLAQAIVPSLTIDSRIHSYNTVLFDRIRDSSGGNFGGLDLPNIFISRVMLTDKHSQNSGRVCKNEQEICAIAASEFGFAILAPETLPWREQIRVFSNARVVAGLFGSGLHTAVFCGQGARIGAIGALNSMQSAIASIRRQHNLYLGTNPPPPAQRFSVDPDQFRRFASILLSKQSKTP